MLTAAAANPEETVPTPARLDLRQRLEGLAEVPGGPTRLDQGREQTLLFALQGFKVTTNPAKNCVGHSLCDSGPIRNACKLWLCADITLGIGLRNIPTAWPAPTRLRFSGKCDTTNRSSLYAPGRHTPGAAARAVALPFSTPSAPILFSRRKSSTSEPVYVAFCDGAPQK